MRLRPVSPGQSARALRRFQCWAVDNATPKRETGALIDADPSQDSGSANRARRRQFSTNMRLSAVESTVQEVCTVDSGILMASSVALVNPWQQAPPSMAG